MHYREYWFYLKLNSITLSHEIAASIGNLPICDKNLIPLWIFFYFKPTEIDAAIKLPMVDLAAVRLADVQNVEHISS